MFPSHNNHDIMLQTRVYRQNQGRFGLNRGDVSLEGGVKELLTRPSQQSLGRVAPQNCASPHLINQN